MEWAAWRKKREQVASCHISLATKPGRLSIWSLMSTPPEQSGIWQTRGLSCMDETQTNVLVYPDADYVIIVGCGDKYG